MRVAVIGAGGTGGLYGALLARAGHEVRFLARGDHLAAIRDSGLQIRSTQFGEFSVRAPATDNPTELGEPEFILFTVKTYDLEAAARAIAPCMGPNTAVLTVQNGLEAPDQLADIVGRAAVLIGTTALETTVAEPGVVAHLSPHHAITLSELDGPTTPRVETLVSELRAAGINASAVADGRGALWRKALFLIPFASITAVANASAGPLRGLPETRQLWDDLIDEAVAVSRACGHSDPASEAWARGVVGSVQGGMRASMARDFERGRRTELDALTGAIVRLGSSNNVPVPVTKAVYALLKFRAAQ